MARNTEERRETLRNTLIDLAQAQVTAHGISTLRARDLAKQAGCSVGAIYNVFPDLTALGLAVNARTFEAMGAVIQTHVAQANTETPSDHLIALAEGYLAFAVDNIFAWRALFEIELTSEAPAPEWYNTQMNGLFAFIVDPVAQLFPDLDHSGAQVMARALFSSVHGIVTLGLNDASAGVPRDRISTMIAMVLTRLS